MTEVTLEHLLDKLADPEFAGVRFEASYQPSGGMGARVFPPTFPTDGRTSPYLFEERHYNGEIHRAVVLDQVPSQANRCEEAEARAWRQGVVRMPMLRMQHEGNANFELIGLEAPHRAFDAYWRDCLLDDVPFDKTEIGKAILTASQEDATGLLTYDPATLVYGGWNSHREGQQAKFPRLYSSEIIGWDPVEGTRKAGRMDPANLTGSRTGTGDDWTYSQSGTTKKDNKLSVIGHGNIAPGDAHGGVTISEATRTAVLSLTATRRVGFGSLEPEAATAAQALLFAFGLLGDRLAFGEAGLWLRSGCDLAMQTEQLAWIGRGGVMEPFVLSPVKAIELYDRALQAALDAGAPLHLETVELVPNEALRKAIEFSLTKAESSEE